MRPEEHDGSRRGAVRERDILASTHKYSFAHPHLSHCSRHAKLLGLASLHQTYQLWRSKAICQPLRHPLLIAWERQ